MKNTPHTSRIGRFLALLAISSLLLPVAPAQQQGTTQSGTTQSGAAQGSSQQTPPAQKTPPAQQTPPAQDNNGVVNIHQMPPPPPPEPPKGGKGTITTNVDLVQIDATITDSHGAAIKSLKMENFQLSEEGKSQKITGLDY